MIYLVRAEGKNADASHRGYWMILWAIADVSIGVSITGTFSLPKFVEAEGPKLRRIFSRLTRPLTPERRVGIPVQPKEDRGVASQERKPNDMFPATEHSSQSDLIVCTDHDHDLERGPSKEDVHDWTATGMTL